MEKNVRLADIYVRIYNKRPLTFDDLVFLSKYDRECFEKTCQNVMYNLADAKEKNEAEKTAYDQAEEDLDDKKAEKTISEEPEQKPDIGRLLENMKKMQWEDFPVPMIHADSVKNLLGSLYMEKLFPHNDKYKYFRFEDHTDTSTFNKKA